MDLLTTITAFFKTSDAPLLIGVMSLLFGLLSLALSLYIYRRSQHHRLPRSVLYTKTIIQEIQRLSPKITLSSDKLPLDRLGVTKMYFWNGGRATIRCSDIPSMDPLMLRAANGGGCIIDAVVLCQSRLANGFAVKTDASGNFVKVHFEYIDHLEGCVIQIAHSCRAASITVDGSVIGFGSIRIINPEWTWLDSLRALIIWLPLLLLVIILPLFALPPAWALTAGAICAILLMNLMVRLTERGIARRDGTFLERQSG
jgi:hypothetical protein